MSTTEFSIVCSIRCPTVIRVHVETARKKIKCFHFFFSNIEIFRQKTGNSKRTCVGFYSGNKTGPTSVVIPVFFAYLTVETWRRPCLDLQKKKSCSQPKTPTRAWSAAKKKERGAARAVERRSWGEKERRETRRDTDTWSCYRPADRCDEQTGELRRCGNKITFAAESPARTHDAQFSPPESGQLLRTDLWS